MEHTTLYRKYRPSAFSDILGQDHIIGVLAKSAKENKIAHAYLFSGSRGTGKTSVARILAREIGTNPEDVYEIDAASNRGIDDIRELREAVNVLPFSSTYKVYIIDEVHMLTKEAWAALLKTVEEPPRHVVFILATTELDKVPETIVSRCETYVFRKPNDAMLALEATRIAKKEGYTFEKGAPDLIALLGDGSFRDTMSILQKVLTYASDKKIALSDVEEITGSPKESLIRGLITALSHNDIERALEVVHSLEQENVDIRTFTKILLMKIRALLVMRYAPNAKTPLLDNIGEDEKVFLGSALKESKGIFTAGVLEQLLTAYQKEKNAGIQVLPLELAIMEILAKSAEQGSLD